MIELLAYYEPLWLFTLLVIGLCIEFHSNFMLRKEFEYDEQKDLEKKHRRTKTTKKTTTSPKGDLVTEESTEISEPIEDRHENKTH